VGMPLEPVQPPAVDHRAAPAVVTAGSPGP
jgi:hypothetical protein